MSAESNIFLDMFSPKQEPQVEETSDNIFLNMFPKKEKVPPSASSLESARKGVLQKVKESPRLLMQGALGTALGRILFSPAGVGGVIAPIAIPGAIQQSLQEEEEFHRDLPPRLKKALDLPEFKPEVAKKASKELYGKITGKEGPLNRLVQLPFEAAGIDTEPQNETEQAVKNVGEIVTSLGGAKQFSELIFKELPEGVKNFFKNDAADLLNRLVGNEKLPESVYETAEKILGEVNQIEAPTKAASLNGRVTRSNERLNVHPPTEVRGQLPQEPPTPNEQRIRDQFRQSITPAPRISEHQMGESQIRRVQEVAREARSEVNQAYDVAEEAYQGLADIYPNLVNRLQESRERILSGRNLNLLNSAESNVITSIDNLLSSLTTEEGAFIEQPVSSLLRTAKSWSSKLNHEEIFGDVKRFLSNLIPEINNSALQAVQRQGGNPELMREADRIYSGWAQRFANDEIAPYLHRTIRNPEALARKSISDEGTYRALHEALEGTAYQEPILSHLNAEIAESRLDPFLKDLEKVNSPQYAKEIRDIRDVIGENPTANLDATLRRSRGEHFPERNRPFRAEKRVIGRAPLPSPIEKSAKEISQFLDKKPEDILRMAKTRSGLKNLKETLDKSSKGKLLYKQLKGQKIRDILLEGKISSKPTGKNLHDLLNKRENFEILSELMGEDATMEALSAAKKISEKRLTPDALKKIGANAVTLKFYKELMHLFPSVF